MWHPALAILLVIGPAVTLAEQPHSEPKVPAIQVECHGILRSGVVAVGGETTGTTLTFSGMTWELQLPDESSRAFAREHHKKPMTVIGSLRKVRGTETSVRWIVDVIRMSPRDAKKPEGALVTVHGKLRTRDAAGEPTGYAIEADSITWPLDLSAEQLMPAQAKTLVGKPAVLTGRLERRPDAKSLLPILCVLNLQASKQE